MADNNKTPEELRMEKIKPLFIEDTEIRELMKNYIDDKNQDTFNDMLNKMVAIEVVVPSTITEDKKVHPLFIKDQKQEKTWLACYTSITRVPTGENAPKSEAVTKIPFMDALKTVEQADADGILINAFTDNLFLIKDLCKKMIEVEENKKKRAQIQEEIKNAPGEGDILIRVPGKDGKPQMVRMNDEQYDIFMRQQVEFALLPKKFFGDGDALIADLSDRREEAIDAFYEECYELKRYYPYVLDDFQVMPLDINEKLTVVRIEMPARKLAAPASLRVYLVWNKEEKTGRYFTVEITRKKDVMIMAEITPDTDANRWKHTVVNPNVTEGTELQEIVELVK